MRALVTRADGGLFLEPGLSWGLPPGAYAWDYGEGASLGLTTRQDVILFEYYGVDSGVVPVFARVGDHAARVDVLVEGNPPPDDLPPDPAPPPPLGCSCSEAPPGALLAAGLTLLRLRRRR